MKNKITDSENREIVRRQGEALKSMRDLLNTLLDISRLDAGIVTPKFIDFPVQNLFERIRSDYASYADEKNASLRVVNSKALIHTDPGLLERVVHNLLANAFLHAQATKILIGCRRRDAGLRIEVWDNGIGIPTDKLTAIFEEFYQLDNPNRDRGKGLGLGLAIADRLSRLLGHAVEVRSVPGKGSVFAVIVSSGGGDNANQTH